MSLSNKGDAATIKGFYRMLKDYIAKAENDEKILESEADIKAGRLLSHQQVKDIVTSWKK